MDTGIGAALREAREAQSRSIDDVALSLRARVTQLRDLEEERFDAFGGDVYAKGFLKSYAIEVGLDPAPLLDTYRREVTPEDETPALISGVAKPRKQRSASPPAWMAWVLVGVIAVAVVGIIGMLGPGTTPETAGPDDNDASSPPPSSVNEENESDGDADDDANDTNDTDDADQDGANDTDGADEEPEPEVDGVELLLEFEDRSWMRIEVDGMLVLEEIVEAGEILPFDGDEEIMVRFGNAGGVRAQLNGEDLGAQGGRGDVVSVSFTPEGAEAV